MNFQQKIITWSRKKEKCLKSLQTLNFQEIFVMPESQVYLQSRPGRGTFQLLNTIIIQKSSTVSKISFQFIKLCLFDI